MAHGVARRRPFDHGVGEAAEAVHLHLDDVARRHRPRVPGRPRQHHVARHQGHVAAQVREQVVDAPDHLSHRRFLHDLAVEPGAERRAPHVHAVHDAGPDRAEAVHALDPQHGARVDIAKVVRAHVVGGGESRQMIPDLVGRRVLQRPTHDGGDLAFVVEPVAAGGPPQVAAMDVERARRLHEVGRRLAIEIAAELDRARAEVQVRADDLAGLARWQVSDREEPRICGFGGPPIGLGPEWHGGGWPTGSTGPQGRPAPDAGVARGVADCRDGRYSSSRRGMRYPTRLSVMT